MSGSAFIIIKIFIILHGSGGEPAAGFDSEKYVVYSPHSGGEPVDE